MLSTVGHAGQTEYSWESRSLSTVGHAGKTPNTVGYLGVAAYSRTCREDLTELDI